MPSYIPPAPALEFVAELDVGGPYEFDLVTVWRATDGKLWAAHDAGCSCPAPFEDHVWPTDYTQVRQLADVTALLSKQYDTAPAIRRLDFVHAVRKALAA